MKLKKIALRLFYVTFACFIAQFKTYAADTVNITIEGTVTATTCEISPNTLDFQFGDVVVSKVNGVGANLASGISAPYNLKVTFTCPPGLLVKFSLDSASKDTKAVKEQDRSIKTNQPDGGLSYQLSYRDVVSNQQGGSPSKTIVYDKEFNIMNSADSSEDRTNAGTNEIELVAWLKQTGTTVTATGQLTGSTTLNIKYGK